MVRSFKRHTSLVQRRDNKIGRLRSAFQAASIEESSSPTLFRHIMNNTSFHLEQRSVFGKYQALAEGLVDSTQFKIFVAVLIIVNALFIGVMSDVSVKRSINSYDNGSQEQYADILRSPWLLAGDILFSVLFFIELMLRGRGPRVEFL